MFNKLEGGSFEEELYRLLMRYTPGNTIDKTKISTRAQQALSTPLHNMLHNLIGSTTERLASPLNVAMPTSAYWSLHERDRLFGANWNAYSVQWTGASVAIPDHTDSSAAVQAIKWAQQSALQTTMPTLTLLVLPANGSSGTDGGYMRWVQQHSQHCKHLLCLPKTSLTWQLPANALHEKVSKGKLNMNVVAVGNAAGFSAHLPYWTPGWREKLQHSARDAVQQDIPRRSDKCRSYIANADAAWWTQPPNTPQHTTAYDRRLPRTFRALPSDLKVPKRTASVATLTNESDMRRAVQRAKDVLTARYGSAPALRHDWRQFAYTDGSVLQGKGGGDDSISCPGIGAANHVPAANQY